VSASKRKQIESARFPKAEGMKVCAAASRFIESLSAAARRQIEAARAQTSEGEISRRRKEDQ